MARQGGATTHCIRVGNSRRIEIAPRYRLDALTIFPLLARTCLLAAAIRMDSATHEIRRKIMLTKIAIAFVLAFAAVSSVSASPYQDVRKPRNSHHFNAGGPTTTGRAGLTGAPSSTNPAATTPNGLL